MQLDLRHAAEQNARRYRENVSYLRGYEAAANAEAVAAAQVSAQAAAVSVSNSGSVDQSGDGCYRNNTVIQINLGIVQTVKNCIRLLKECAE